MLKQAHQGGKDPGDHHVDQGERQEDLVDRGRAVGQQPRLEGAAPATDNVATSAVSLMMTTPWLASGGMTFRSACGRTTMRNAALGVSPMARPCLQPAPLRTDWMPAR